MPQLIPVALSYAASALAGAAVISGTVGATLGITALNAVTWTGVIGTVVGIGSSFALSAVMGGGGGQAEQAAQDRKHMVRGTAEPRQVIYGTARVSGALVYAGSSGPNKEFLHLVLPVATHSCKSISTVWLNGTAIEPSQLDANGNLTDRAHPMFGRVRIQRVLGKHTAPPADLIAESPDGHTVDHAIFGASYLYLRLQYDPERMPNLPNVECLVEGRDDIWDPRSNTTGWTNNWALCTLDYVRWDYGLRTPLDLIDLPTFIAAANLSDELVQITAAGAQQPRYRLDGAFKLSEDTLPANVLQGMLDAGAGRMYRVAGRFRLFAGAYRAPTGSISASDLTGKTRIVSRHGRSRLYNGVRTTFIDPARDWGAHPATPISDPAMVAQDGGFPLWRELDLPFVADRTQAERIARIKLLEHRDGLTIQAPVKFAAIRFCVGQVVEFSDPRPGMEGKVFEVMDWTFDPSGLGVVLMLEERAPFTYAWNFDLAYGGAPAPNTTLVNPLAIQPPQGLSISEEICVAQAGAGVRTRAIVEWLPPPNPFVQSYEVQTRPEGALEWRSVAPTAGQTRAEIDDLSDGLHYIRVRARSLIVPSDWAEVQFRSGAILAQPPQNLTGLSVQCIGGLAYMRWDRHPDLDVRIGGRIEFRHTSAPSPAWSNSTSIGLSYPGDATFGVLPLKSGWYLAKAVDAGGRYSADAVVAFTSQATALAWTSLVDVREDPAWTGSNSGTIVVDGKLRLDGVGLIDAAPSIDAVPSIDWLGGIAASGTYSFGNSIALASVRRVRLTASLSAVVIASPENAIDARPALVDDWLDFDGITGGETDAWIEVRDTPDDPAGSPVWSPWRRLDAAEFAARGFLFRARLRCFDPAYNLEITNVRIACEEVA